MESEYKISPDTVFWSIVLLAVFVGISIGFFVSSSVQYEKGYKAGWSDGVRDEKIGTLEEITPLKGAINGKDEIDKQGKNKGNG